MRLLVNNFLSLWFSKRIQNLPSAKVTQKYPWHRIRRLFWVLVDLGKFDYAVAKFVQLFLAYRHKKTSTRRTV